ncbi:MAG TPA: Mur ligase family protein, partial [Puia sp.]|nr:Mur ligase family protein [Puia sp.]
MLTDSRRLIFPDTTLFFALSSPRRTGEQFIEELYQRGVRNFVVNKKIDVANYEDANIILVKNSLNALQQLAAFQRSKFDIPVIGITGSNGKTIIKEWLNQLLEDDYNIVRSPRSYNSQIGVPLSVWQMNESNELGIFEAGISQADEMKKLEKVIQPTIGIFTNLGEAHNEGFKNLQHKIEEKVRLFKNATVLIYNSEDENISKTLVPLREERGWGEAELFSWGKNKNATVRIKKISKTGSNTSVDIFFNKQNFSLVIPFTDD